MHLVREGLYIASLDDVTKVEELVSRKVTFVLTLDSRELCKDLKLQLAHHGISTRFLPMHDTVDFYMLNVVEDAVIELETRKHSDVTVVHCFAGISRSASIVIAFIMKTENLPYDDAFASVKDQKADICPNPGFAKQLKVFGMIGYKVDQSHSLMKRIKKDVHQASWSTTNVENLLKENEDLNALEIKCRCCRLKLNSPGNVRHFKSDCCSSIFLYEQEEWIIDVLKYIEGKIYCPQCKSKLGSFNWSGSSCSCKEWITPSFQIHKSKVDVHMT